MSLITEWRDRIVAEQVDALLTQASDLLEVAALHPTTLPGQRARRQASYLKSHAREWHQLLNDQGPA